MTLCLIWGILFQTLDEILTANGIDPKSKEVADDSNDVEKFIKQLDNPLRSQKFNEYNTKLLKSHTPSVDFERIIKNLIPKGKEMEENLVKKMRVEDSDWFFGKNQNVRKSIYYGNMNIGSFSVRETSGVHTEKDAGQLFDFQFYRGDYENRAVFSCRNEKRELWKSKFLKIY